MNRFFTIILALILLSLTSLSNAADFDVAIWKALIGINNNGFAASKKINYFITMDVTTNGFEESAISAYNWSDKNGVFSVGGALRAYSAGINGATWGVAVEAINGPLANNSALIGAEILIGSRSAYNDANKWALNLILRDRVGEMLESPIGGNEFNENSVAIQVDALPRSSLGEFSGWNTFAKFNAHAFDRTISKSYASVLDLSEIQPLVPIYLVVYRCGNTKCGLRYDDSGGLQIWKDLDTVPYLLHGL